jgi:LPXTG-motif cell wall-anchored protein
MRVRPGRLTTGAACCAAIIAAPSSVAHATSPGATLSIGASASARATAKAKAKAKAPARLTTEPARPAPSAAHARRARGVRDHAAGLNGRRNARDHATAPHGRMTARAAGDPGVAIADFRFSPSTTTIHVGDTITWSNSGPSSHTATATNGSFNTGILKKGHSASHTFTQAGTFAYVCQIHPFMHGTIIVLASTTSTTTSATTSTPTATTPTAATPTAATPAATSGPPGPTLPNTGFDVLSGLSAGLVLLGAGAALRRTRRRGES